MAALLSAIDPAVSPEELHCLKERCAHRVLGLRFQNDRWCQALRFETLRRELGPSFEALELPVAANPDSPNPRAHSVLTNDLIDRDGERTQEAAKRVIAFLPAQVSAMPQA